MDDLAMDAGRNLEDQVGLSSDDGAEDQLADDESLGVVLWTDVVECTFHLDAFCFAPTLTWKLAMTLLTAP